MTRSSPLQQLADFVRASLEPAGYVYEEGRRTGDLRRLAKDTQAAAERLGGYYSGMDQSVIGRLLRAERMPQASALYPLAVALKVDYRVMLAKAGIIPESMITTKDASERPPLTPDEVADEWGIRDEAGRALVRAMYERLASSPDATGTREE